MRTLYLRAAFLTVAAMMAMSAAANAQQCARDDADCFIRHYTEQIRTNPDEPENYYNRALMYRDTKQYALARADLDKYLGFNLTNKSYMAEGYRVRGWVSHLMGDDKAAFENIDKAFSIYPDENEGYYMRGMIYNDLKAYGKAVAELTKYIDINAAKPEFMADGLYLRAFAYNRDAKYNLAVADLTKSISLDPSKPHVYTERAFAYRKMGKAALADADDAKAKQLP